VGNRHENTTSDPLWRSRSSLGFPAVIAPQRPHNRYKAPFFVLCLVIGLVCAVIGGVHGAWGLVLLGGVLVAGCVNLLRVIHTGRNPRWMQSPLDPKL
jgi:hypothetical protein